MIALSLLRWECLEGATMTVHGQFCKGELPRCMALWWPERCQLGASDGMHQLSIYERALPGCLASPPCWRYTPCVDATPSQCCAPGSASLSLDERGHDGRLSACNQAGDRRALQSAQVRQGKPGQLTLHTAAILQGRAVPWSGRQRRRTREIMPVFWSLD